MSIPVSITINSYNYGKYLRQTIESALAQTYPFKEVVVVDDGSTDDSRSIMESFGDSIRAVYQINGGMASCMNTCFRTASGEVIFTLDSDDFLRPEAVEKVMQLWSPEISVANFYLDVVDGEGKRLPEEGTKPAGVMSNANLRNEILSGRQIWTSTCSGSVFSKKFVQAILPIPEENVHLGPDRYLNYLSCLLGERLIIHESLGFYRFHGANNFAVAEEFKSLRTLRYLVLIYRLVGEEIVRRSREWNLEAKPGILHGSFRHIYMRILSYSYDRKTHPISGDTKWILGVLLFKAFRLDTVLNFSYKAKTTLKSVALLLVPAFGSRFIMKQCSYRD